jgi:murein DD-endopeptidase MepM/ murein hydrolase activator NlpD
LRPHHGVDFNNEHGTPVLSAEAGSVTFVGPDADATLGPEPGFYGRVVVVRSHHTFLHQPVYVLYGHLETTTVSVGQLLAVGEPLGTVGGSGVAKGGSHLHLEVRVGHNDYRSTRNPELWLRPYPGWGTLAGRVTDNNGTLLPLANITVRSEKLDEEDADPFLRYLTTYVSETINPDELLGENFALADLPAGIYTVSVNTGHKAHTQKVTISSDQLSFVEFKNLLSPATWTPTPIAMPIP